MGLDMYMTARCFIPYNADEKFVKQMKHMGMKLTSLEYELGYWRKHHNLHGYIVQEFADGVDDCQEIDLGVGCLNKIKEAIQEGDLPDTEGFFFGSSSNESKEDDIEIIDKAIKWLEGKDSKGCWRSIYYQASW